MALRDEIGVAAMARERLVDRDVGLDRCRSVDAASRRKIKLPDQVAVDAEIKLNLEGASFFLTARLDVSVPGLDREVAQELIQAAHGICPYSKAMLHGNIAIEANLV